MKSTNATFSHFWRLEPALLRIEARVGLNFHFCATLQDDKCIIVGDVVNDESGVI